MEHTSRSLFGLEREIIKKQWRFSEPDKMNFVSWTEIREAPYNAKISVQGSLIAMQTAGTDRLPADNDANVTFQVFSLPWYKRKTPTLETQWQALQPL